MKTTLSMKLCIVLTHGILSTMSFDELIAELDKQYNDPQFKSIYTKDEAYKEIKERSYTQICYRFVPYSDNNLLDLCEVRQWTNKANTIVNHVFDMIQAELK